MPIGSRGHATPYALHRDPVSSESNGRRHITAGDRRVWYAGLQGPGNPRRSDHIEFTATTVALVRHLHARRGAAASVAIGTLDPLLLHRQRYQAAKTGAPRRLSGSPAGALFLLEGGVVAAANDSSAGRSSVGSSGRAAMTSTPSRRESSAYRYRSPLPCRLERFATTIAGHPLTRTQSNRHDPGRCHKFWRWSWRTSELAENVIDISVV